jgi:predicted ArsR family transcriptional regulator
MADFQLQRAIYRCPCSDCLDAPSSETARDHVAINRLVAALDERQRRLFAGLLALRRGRGGIVTLAKITGLSRMTIRRGLAELRSGVGPVEDRVRKPGGGRPSIEKKCLRP